MKVHGCALLPGRLDASGGQPGAGGVPHRVAYARVEVAYARVERGSRDPDVFAQALAGGQESNRVFGSVGLDGEPCNPVQEVPKH
jgi:hypothetical protein